MPAAYTALNFADAEVPVWNGTTLTLKFAPNPAQSLLLVQNGLVLTNGIDYTVSGANVKLLYGYNAADKFIAWYRY